MRLVLALVLVIGCGSKNADDRPDPTVDDPWLRKVPKPVPAGPYVVAYDCSHSMMPWGKGGSINNSSADLAKRTWTSLAYEYTGEITPEPFRPPPPKVSAMSPAVADTLRTKIEQLLAGGPYRQELPPSEGISCILTVTTAAGAPVFTIAKAATEEKDTASELIKLFFASYGR